MKSLILCLLLLLGVWSKFHAQNFLNGDLNGTIAVSACPTSWSQVPNTDPLSVATGNLQATSDVTGVSGPLAGSGISGTPYSGSTFVSGLLMSASGMVWHEGLQQTVSGLVIGNQYQITFWQSVVQQSNATDNSGSWSVYSGNTLLGTSAPTMTYVSYSSLNLNWELRTITFTATATSQLFKFLPADDDASFVGNAGIRMGIDNINLSPAIVLAPEFDFSLKAFSQSVLLSWETNPAEDVLSWQVDRSEDGIHFENLETIEAIDGRLSMEYTDFHPLHWAYYQIGSVMRDGSVRYSQVHAISMEPELNAAVVRRNLTVWGGSSSFWEVALFDMNGAQVLRGTTTGNFDLSSLKSGIYIVQIASEGENPQLISRKIVLED